MKAKLDRLKVELDTLGARGPNNSTADVFFFICLGLLKEAAERFPDDYLHVGSDEVIFDCYDRDSKVKKFLSENGMSKGHDLYKYFTDRTIGYGIFVRK